MQSIKEQHEEQIQQILSETKAKIEYYKNKLGGDSEQLKQIELLQACLNEKETDKQQTLLEFQNYKRNAEQKEFQMKTEYSQRILELTDQVSGAKRDFETKLQSIESLREQYDRDKRKTIEDLTEKHRKDLEQLLESQQGKEGNLLSAKRELEQKYEAELQQLRDKVEQLDTEKLQLSSDYESKLSKAQAFYERELEALRQSQNAGAQEEVRLLREQHDKLVKDFAFTEKQLQSQVQQLLEKLSISEDEFEKCKAQLDRLQKSINDQDSASQSLLNQVGRFTVLI